MQEIKPKRMKHNYTDELELKSLIIRINNRSKKVDAESFLIDDSVESIARNTLINRYIKLYKKVKAVKSESISRKLRLRETRHKIKQIIIDLSVECVIDKNSYEMFGSIVLLMIKSILTKPNFANTGYDAEFYSDSVYKISKYIHNFDHLKISERSGLPGNAFAYVSQIIHNAFLFICNKKRDERANHKKQINMEMLDDNQQLKYVDFHIDDRTRHHVELDTMVESIYISKIEEDETLIDHIKRILNHSDEWGITVDQFEIVYPEEYRITFDEFNDLKPLLNGKFVINRAKPIEDTEPEIEEGE